MYVFLNTDNHATSPAFNPANYLFTLNRFALSVYRLSVHTVVFFIILTSLQKNHGLKQTMLGQQKFEDVLQTMEYCTLQNFSLHYHFQPSYYISLEIFP
jgi:hypothetical protein